jgi:hypothetical protein
MVPYIQAHLLIKSHCLHKEKDCVWMVEVHILYVQIVRTQMKSNELVPLMYLHMLLFAPRILFLWIEFL